MTLEEQIKQLEEQLAQSKANEAKAIKIASQDNGEIYCRVSEKGALSVYNVQGRFPLSPYPKGWLSVAKALPTVILPFLVTHWDEFSFGKDATTAKISKAKLMAELDKINAAYDGLAELLS